MLKGRVRDLIATVYVKLLVVLATQDRYCYSASAVARISHQFDPFYRGKLRDRCPRSWPIGTGFYPPVVFRVIWTLITAVSGTPATTVLKPMIARTVMAPPMTSLSGAQSSRASWKPINAARRGAARDAASRGPSWRPSSGAFIVDEDGQALWGPDARSARGDVGDVDMAASSRYSLRASSGRSSFSYLPTAGSISSGGSPSPSSTSFPCPSTALAARRLLAGARGVGSIA